MPDVLIQQLDKQKLKKDVYHIQLTREQGNLAGKSGELVLDKNCQLKAQGDIPADEVRLVSRIGDDGLCGGIHHIESVELLDKFPLLEKNYHTTKENSTKIYSSPPKKIEDAFVYYSHKTQGLADWFKWLLKTSNHNSAEEGDVTFKVIKTEPDTIKLDYNILGYNSDYSAEACLALEIYTISV